MKADSKERAPSLEPGPSVEVNYNLQDGPFVPSPIAKDSLIDRYDSPSKGDSLLLNSCSEQNNSHVRRSISKYHESDTGYYK